MSHKYTSTCWALFFIRQEENSRFTDKVRAFEHIECYWLHMAQKFVIF